jgi:sortase A
MWAAVVLAVLVFVGALIAPPALALSIGDKAAHFIAFASIAVLAVRGGGNVFAAAAMLCVFASATEIAQAAWTMERSASVVDALASMLGAVAGIAVAQMRGWRAISAGAFACMAGGILIDLGIDAARPQLTRALVAEAWREGSAAGRPRAPWPGAPARIAWKLDMAGRSTFVADASDRRALAMAPGLWPGHRPGDAGTTIVLGHRNGEFSVLGELEEGAVVAVENVDGERRRYRVISREVVLWNASGLTPHTRQEVLALVTCWPIGAYEPTPWRLVVRAEPLGGADALHASSLSMRSSSVVR